MKKQNENIHVCRKCGGGLVRCEVVNVETKARMGHTWNCPDCDLRFVGFGDTDEYDGTVKEKVTNDE